MSKIMKKVTLVMGNNFLLSTLLFKLPSKQSRQDSIVLVE